MNSFAIYEESPEDSTHQDYRYGMFERHFGASYYSFDHKGWHFMVLNTIDVKGKRYIGLVNDKEIEWIKQDLAKVDKSTPIAIAIAHSTCVYLQTDLSQKTTH